MLHLSEFVWILRSLVLVVFSNFLLIDATGRSKIRSDQKRVFIALSLYLLSFFANTPFNEILNFTKLIISFLFHINSMCSEKFNKFSRLDWLFIMFHVFT